MSLYLDKSRILPREGDLWRSQPCASDKCVAGLSGLIKRIRRICETGAQIRAEHLIRLRRQFYEREDFRIIREFLAHESEDLTKIDVQTRLEFLTFFDELAILRNTKLLSPHVANYMFGFYVIRAARCD